MNKIILMVLSLTSLSIKSSDREAMARKADELEKRGVASILGTTRAAMARMLDIKPADIHHFYNNDTPISNSYSGVLADGRSISAYYFKAGPMAGEYDCSCNVSGFQIPLRPSKKYFDMLKAGYEAKSK